MTRIAYLISTYPAPSQTFIRREILALEALGLAVDRFALRRFADGLVAEADRAEERRTHYVLDAGATGLARALAATALRRPLRWLSALKTAVALGRRSEKGPARFLIYLAEACALNRELSRRGIRHVHTHFATNGAVVALLCQQLGGVAYSLMVHGSEEFDAPRQLSLGTKVHHAAFVAAISEYTRSQLYRWSALEDWDKIHVVRCGLDGEFLDAPPVPAPGRPRLVNVGRLVEQKGQLLLVRAAELLLERGVDFELVLVGDGPLRDLVERRIAGSALRGRVRITGYLDGAGVLAEIQAARALVLPSFAEGVPVVIFEAMAAGRPVISTYVGGIPELVEPGRNGWLVPAGALGPLVEAMGEALAAAPAALDRMGRAGRARAIEQHSVATEARKLVALLRGAGAIDGPAGRGLPTPGAGAGAGGGDGNAEDGDGVPAAAATAATRV